ncbi:MAG: hypothetical protein WBP79_05190 [Candidatus Acidiferrales bacterium]
MTLLIFFLSIAAGLMLVLIMLARRGSRPEGSAQGLVEAQHALRSLQHDLLPPELIERIFAEQDRDYIASSVPLSVQELFIEERRKIAFSWVRQVRSGILSLRSFHRSQARFYARMTFGTEIELALHFAALLAFCRTLQVVLYFGGPYAAPKMVGKTVGIAEGLCRASEKSLAFMKPPSFDAFAGHSGDSGAAG